MKRFALALAAGLVSLVPFAQTASAQPSRSEAGMLECDVSAGMGMIIGSRKDVSCVFTPSNGARPETYLGTISKYGFDFGGTAGGRMVWAVAADTTLRRGALAGRYGGPSGEATVGAGLGANVLVGGSNRTVSLQPISLQAQTGLNVAVGVAELELLPARPQKRTRRHHHRRHHHHHR